MSSEPKKHSPDAARMTQVDPRVLEPGADALNHPYLEDPSVASDNAPSAQANGVVDSGSEALEHGKRWLMDFFPNLRDAGLRWSQDDAGD